MFQDDSDDEECKKCNICLAELMKEDLVDHVYSCLISLKTLHGEPIAVKFLITRSIIAEEFRGTDYKEIITAIKHQHDPQRPTSQMDCQVEVSEHHHPSSSKAEEDNSIFTPKYQYKDNFFLVPHHMDAVLFKKELNTRIAELTKIHIQQSPSEITLYSVVHAK